MGVEGMVPPQEVLESMRQPMFTHIQSMQQICDSLLDIALFGDAEQQKISIEEVVHGVYRDLVILMGNKTGGDIDDALNGYLLRASRFYHFIDYPACYYSYVMAQKMSDQIWQRT